MFTACGKRYYHYYITVKLVELLLIVLKVVVLVVAVVIVVLGTRCEHYRRSCFPLNADIERLNAGAAPSGEFVWHSSREHFCLTAMAAQYRRQ